MYTIEEIADGTKDWSGRPKPDAIQRRRDIAEDMALRDVALMGDMIGEIRSGRGAMQKEFCSSLMLSIGGESLARTTRNPMALLNCALEEGDDPLDDQMRFEAISTFDLARMALWVEQQPRESRGGVEEDVHRVVGEFKTHLFKPVTERPLVWARHDPSDEYRASEISIGPDDPGWPAEETRKEDMRFHITQSGLHTLFDDRAKELFNTVGKMLKQRAEGDDDWTAIRDRRGVIFITRNEEDIDVLFEEIKRMYDGLGGSFERKKERKANRQKSPSYKAKKGWIFTRRRRVEVQVLDVRSYFSTRYSTGDENHHLYRLRQLGDEHGYGNMFWPEKIYGIDWKHETSVGGPLHNEAVTTLNWRKTRTHPTRRKS